MRALQRGRLVWHEIRHGWASVPSFYIFLTLLAFTAYRYLVRLPEGRGVLTASQLWMSHGSILTGLMRVKFIFIWGFVVQLLLQFIWVIRRKPREAQLGLLIKHGTWLSLNAGIFEELIFRLYAFLSLVILAKLANVSTNGLIETVTTHLLLPIANFATLGLLSPELNNAHWAMGLGVIAGSIFFRDAHLHYRGFSKLNVWFIGLVIAIAINTTRS